MFCSNCGKEIPDNTKFCNYCGAQQKTAADQQPPATQEKQQPPKKFKNLLITAVVVVCAFLIGKFVIAPSMTTDTPKDSESTKTPSQSQQTVSTPNIAPSTTTDTPKESESTKSPTQSQQTVGTSNPDYMSILAEAWIVHIPDFFLMDTESFVSKQEGDTIYCIDYGCEGDLVKQWVETLYIPIFEYTDAEKTELENEARALFAEIDALSCCTVSYKMSKNYFTVKATYSDVDKEENYTALYEAEVLETNAKISVSASEKKLLAEGFVKK